jgi:adenylate kinase
MILFFGPPGSGKSVQGQLLVERNGWKWLSTGQLFRETTDEAIRARMASGELISDEMTNKVVNAALHQMKDPAHIVLDGYPRNVEQAQWLVDNLPAHGREIATVMLFQTPEDELIRRQAGRGRDDDTEDVIRRRLEIYNQQTQPVIEFYKAQGVPILTIDGFGSVDEVHERVQAAAEQQNLTVPSTEN